MIIEITLAKTLGLRAPKKNSAGLLSSISRITIFILAILTVMATVGIDVSAIITSLGLTGFALGFALRDVLSNIVSGIMILLYQPFKTGQVISVAGFEGEVIGMDLRYISLKMEGKTVLIPNATVFTSPVTIQERPPSSSSPKNKGNLRV